MTLESYLKIPELKHRMRTIPAGTYLFKQGQSGTTMFILMSGTVELLGERDEGEHVEAILEIGQFLGEKAILQDTPYQRVFSARAATETTALELSAKDIEVLQEIAPKVMTDLLKRVFRVAGERLSRSNYLVRVLRSSNNDERLLHCIHYFCRTSSKRTPKGVEVKLTPESIHFYIDMDPRKISATLDALVGAGVMIRAKENWYLVPDENAVLEFFHGKQAA